MLATQKNKVLIVDDETSNIIALTHILQPDYNIYAVKNGVAAIEAAKKHQPDVILLDIIMPEMDGYMVISALKEYEMTRNIPVIFISGLSDDDDKERGLALGAADYLTKPFSTALVKLRVSNQVKLIEQFRTNEYDIMKYKLSNDALNIALWDMDVVSSEPVNPQNIFKWSAEFRHMLGFSDESDFPNILQSWSERLHPDDYEKTLNAFEAHLTDYTGQIPYDVESRIKMKTGEYRHFRALGTTHRDNKGTPIRTAGALMDITEKKQMEREIADNMAKIEKNAHWYKSILDAIPLPVTVTDADMNWTFVNKAVEDFLNMRFEDMLGKPCSNWASEICGTDKCGVACAKRGLRRTFFNRDESSYQIDVEVLHDIEGTVAGFIEVVQDITNIQQLAKERAEVEMTSQAKSAFLANMSHEIRTPMNAILGITEILMQDETLPDGTVEGLGKIYNSCDLLLGIINDILDFSKIEANKLDIIAAEYNTAGLINDSINLNIMRIGEKQIKFEVEVDENIPSKLIGDELRIKQILNNLLSNAFKYTDKGMVSLTAFSETGAKRENGEEDIILVISVQDTGHGMTEAQVDKLFDEYSRFNQDAGHTIEGTGLGLSITQRLINLMGGEIHVQSRPGEGSIFTVRLPQIKTDDEVLGKEVSENLREFRLHYIPSGKKSRIVRHSMSYGSVLVVDDVQTNLYVAEGLMKPYGMKIETAGSGFEAIEKIKNGNVYDIVFMDHMMPIMDGIETTKKLREYGYAHPIIALTANAVAGQAEIFSQNGFDEFISKPIDTRRLNALLNKFIRDKQPPEVIEAELLKNASDEAKKNTESSGTDLLLLESFIKDAHKAVTVLDELCRTKDFEKESNLRTFTITVHGIKSALANIGEAELSKSAFELERAGRESNIELIKTAAPELLKKLHTLIKKLEKNQTTEHGDTDYNIEELLGKLSAVRDACADYNRKDALDAIGKIEKCSKQTKTVIDTIKEFVLHSDFDEAENAAAEYINALSLKQREKTPAGCDKTANPPLKEIKGLNTEKGLERYEGDVSVYLRILRSFAVNARSMIKSMGVFEKDNLKDYETTVHGFKGMSFDIFADETGEKAKALEFAAKDGNLDYIREHNPLFIKTATELIDAVEAALSDIDAKTVKPEKASPDVEVLARLAAACKVYDMDGVEAAMKELDAYKYTSDDGLVQWIRDNVDIMNYSQITQKLSDI
ncbi:MAG: response regulator [Oscillospiraceae bacterium]|nr:response regulator [Oscillospiraceae bacterium]